MLQTWNDFLASLAVSWAAGCRFEHGQPPFGDNPEYTVIGQNLYAVTGDSINLTAGVQAWYDEKSDYDYDTLQCEANKQCGHYTQVQSLYSFHYYYHNRHFLQIAKPVGLYSVCQVNTAVLPENKMTG